jgi:hypothetical protein
MRLADVITEGKLDLSVVYAVWGKAHDYWYDSKAYEFKDVHLARVTSDVMFMIEAAEGLRDTIIYVEKQLQEYDRQIPAK